MMNVYSVNGKNIEVREAKSFFSRFKGLMFKHEKLDYALMFRNTNGIHTFFMFQSIDVVLYNADFNVLEIIENVKPWRVILPKKNVKHTLEVPLGYGGYFKDIHLDF